MKAGKCWARAVQTILMSQLISPSKIVGIGHSAGAAIMILSTMSGLFSSPTLMPKPITKNPYHTLIIIEPAMMTRTMQAKIMAPDAKARTGLRQVIDGARNRRDCWRNKAEAREWMEKRIPWRQWDRDVFQLFFVRCHPPCS
jgi:hypothetical protein